MRIKLLKSVVVPGFPGIRAGTEIEAPERLASILIGRGHAEEAKAESRKQKAEISPPEMVQTREPVAETRDPVVKATAAVKSTMTVGKQKAERGFRPTLRPAGTEAP